MMTEQRKAQGEEMRQTLANWLQELWNLHFEEINNVAEAAGGKTGVAFDIEVDVSAEQASLRGTLNFKRVEKYADSRERQFGDPDPEQRKLEILDEVPPEGAAGEPGEPTPKKRRSKKPEA